MRATEDRLAQLFDDLTGLGGIIDDERYVPGRYASSLEGGLAQMDVAALRAAARVVHRLMLWKRYPSASQETYFAPEPE